MKKSHLGWLVVASCAMGWACSSDGIDPGDGVGGTPTATGGMDGVPTGGAPTTPGAGGASGGTSNTTGGTTGGGGTGGTTGSPGCGTSNGPTSGTYTIDVGGTSRTYVLDVPQNYDNTRPYWLIFAWHWRDGSASDVVNGAWASNGPYYGLKTLSEGSAIFVAPEGIDAGWANDNDRDVNLTKALVQKLEGELCIDEGHVFSTGFSYGGMFSYALGCGMADVFRAIAPMSGSLWSGCAAGSNPIAMWSAHGSSDSVVNISFGRSARDEFIKRNGCSNASHPIQPSPCVEYEGCTEGYPVVWCEWNGDHTSPSFSAQATWDFFSRF